jgi:hypothetical protein
MLDTGKRSTIQHVETQRAKQVLLKGKEDCTATGVWNVVMIESWLSEAECSYIVGRIIE